MARRRVLSADERALWAFVTRHDRPIHSKASRQPRSAEEPTVPEDAPFEAAMDQLGGVATTVPKLIKQAEQPARPEPTPPQKHHAKFGPLERVEGEKRVRRGKVEVGATLDLHGLFQDTARATLSRFLHDSAAEGHACVLVITGKGDGRLREAVFGVSPRGVLRQRVPDWLAAPDLRPIVSRFASAHQKHGGTGAYYVFLRKGG